MKTDIKICGLKTLEAVAAALDGGASHIGFIFFEKSPRHIDIDAAAQLRQSALGRARTVAVTVDASDTMLDAIVAGMTPDMLQFHGSESPERIAALKARYGLEVMKAFPIGTSEDLAALTPYRGIADRFLLDAKPPQDATLPGGNGVSFDWSILTDLDGDVDYMLSGGLNADNIGTAMRQANPRGLDISSGVESAPGIKDPALIRDFFRAVQTAIANEERHDQAG